ncbi:MAG TPA: thermonuclease family protein [Patescibacteria group bacterium]|nr:thermonuclease family protein [Patescibacteria group bacterium]
MSKRSINRWISLATALILLAVAVGQHFGWFGSTAQQAEKSQPGLYAIDHFVDGDTIAVNMDGKVETIRMVGVDTPETHKPNSPVQCYGPAAASYTKTLVGTNKVRLEADEKSTNRDRYNRLLRYVYTPDGKLVEAELIKNGYGFAYTDFPFTKSAEFVQDQASAKADNKGLWGNCQPYQLSSGRWQTNNQ